MCVSRLQGLFFDEAYGFYPGQVLIGPAKVFSNVQWLSGVKPVLSKKSKFRVVVEEVRARRRFWFLPATVLTAVGAYDAFRLMMIAFLEGKVLRTGWPRSFRR